jgi:SAM-dependent methyltransferase
MRLESLFRISDLIVCPWCRALFVNPQVADLTEKGPEYLECSRCLERFPVVKHVPGLAVWDSRGADTLRELLMYHDFYSKLRNRSFEKDRIENKLEEFRNAKEIYAKAYYRAVEQIDFTGSPLVCDIGAGMCETSKMLADRGARVVATDLSPFDILRPRLFSLHSEPINDFYTIFDGVRRWDESEINFRRVLCDALRLPLKDENFDVVFYRSTLHHLASVRQALQEAARILLPQGRLIISCEPSRSILDGEKPYLDYLLDYQEGISEHVPVLPVYLLALLRADFGDISIECFFPSYGHRIRRFLKVWGKHADAQTLDGFKTNKLGGFLKMLPLGCVVNIYARKRRRKRFSRKTHERMATPFGDKTFSDILFEFDDHVALLRKMNRGYLDPGKLGGKIDFSKRLERINSRGWRDVETIGAEKARFPLRDAFCYFSSSCKQPRLKMRVFGVPRRVARKYVLKVFANDEELSLPAPLEPGWQEIEFPIPHVAEQGTYEIHLQQTNLFLPIDVYGTEDYRELGIGVQWMKIE